MILGISIKWSNIVKKDKGTLWDRSIKFWLENCGIICFKYIKGYNPQNRIEIYTMSYNKSGYFLYYIQSYYSKYGLEET